MIRRLNWMVPALGVAIGLTGCGLSPVGAVPEIKAAAAANSAFASDLFGKLREQAGNLFYSPLSIETALAMTSAGARGETLAEMNKVLHLTEPDVADGVGALLRQLRSGEGAGYELYVANAIWGQKGLPFDPGFLARTRVHFAATLHMVDFGKTEEARRTINSWVEEQTRDKIKDLIGRGSLTGRTGMVLTNAIYFKGTWALKFEKAQTRAEPFHAPGGDVKAPLMRQDGRFNYFEDDGVQIVDLPYTGGRVSMTVVLPRAADGLAALQENLNADKLAGWTTKLRPQLGDVMLPRFKTTAAFELQEPLEQLGMKRAFGPSAEFGGILPTEPLWISNVIHKAFVDVNEEGTEAAAATAVIATRAPSPAPPPRFLFRADRPFLFLIRDTTTGTPLFVGRIMNPSTQP
jgi:serpin B